MASCSTTQTVQSSFSSKPQPENDVFLNFRGKDTRDNFTDHLYRALKGKGIKTFKDDTNLELGHPISPNLLDAIEKSRIAVVILSKNYASSRCCLEELVKILECKEEGGLAVLPIFYHVDPDHVQNQRETFAVAFAEHEYRFGKEQVEIWRKALIDVAKLAGKTLTNGPEGEFIQDIVDRIFTKLKFTKLKDKHSIVYEGGFVGIASRVEEMNSVLDMNSNDVCFIGICGKSGMGKTTLARFVFDKIRSQFEAFSFLENVKEVSKACGLETLQEQLLRDISEGALSVRDVNRRIQEIRNILRDKKVLIVVDDASEKRHLEALVGKSWFGPRSRIIVTTDDECLLKSYKIQIVWADGLNNDEAQRLFCQKVHCEIDFLDLVNDFVTYAQGSPLVLKVLGSHLCKRTKEEWESARNQLKAIPNENLLEKLQIAYNGLEELEKKLFLHIACFFKGEDQNRVAAILESVCHWDDNIRKLIDKSLITIVGGKLCMHHLIQQMGWKIVCGEPVEDLGRRIWLWDCTDVLYVLKKNIGTERIEGMVLNLPPDEEQEELKADPFSNMNKLKLLKICKLHLPSLRSLSNELLLLEWHEYPLKSLPKSFRPPELVELIMRRSNIKQLHSEFSNLPKLKLIDFSDSQNLCQTPNFNGLPNIERLIFQGCTGLHALHPSVGSLKRLILLNLKDCKCLENLPQEINLESLKILILSGCSKLKKFPKIGRNMTSMLELYLDRTAIEELPSSIKHLTSLTVLNLQDCENLSSFPSVGLISLKILILSGCKGQPLRARYLSGLIPTLSSIGTTLTLPYTYFTDRQPEPEPISLALPLSFSGLSSLESLNLSGCNLLDGALPDDLSYLSSLTSLNLRNNNFTCLPCSISQLLNLKLLFLDHCSKLQSLPYLPLSTQFVSAQGCTSLENYSNQVLVWTSGAARFTFINCHGLADDEGKIADVPLLNIHFQSLWQRYMEDQILQIKGFCLVLPQIKIPEWFNKEECGPSVEIPLPPNLFNNRSWKGIALCVIFEVPPNLIDVSPGQDSKYFHEFICHFDIDGVSLNCPLVLKVPKETFVGSFGLWLYISHARFTEHSDKGSCIGSVIRRTKSDIQIKMCGAHILYEQHMIEFVQNLRPENFGSCNDLSRGHEKFIEDHMNSSQSSDTKLKQKLNSLVSTLYQVDWAQNHLYDYIFHQIARPPPWFNCNKLGPSIEMQLPTDIHDNSTWLGFTVYAFYRIQMRAGFRYKLDSTIFLRYSSLSASDEVSFAPYMAFPFSRYVFDESSEDFHRLVVFYIPRRVFQMNQCNHIGALFKSSDPAVQFEMCGIRLVYEKNVTKFVQTLVEYMLGSPGANHQSVSEHLSHQLGMLQDCNHEKDYRCPFLPERRPKAMRMLLPNKETTQEECTLRETFSNQVIAAGTSKNSSPGSINFGISFGNRQCGSKMSADSLECWFKPRLQNHHKHRSDSNCCSSQSEIPNCFPYQINRSSVKIFLPSNLYYKPDWVGFAFSTVFSFNKNMMTADHMKQDSGFSLICHLKTDLGCMNPLLYHGIREEDVLTSIHQRAFLWQSFISHQLLSPEWSECNWVEFSFVSDSLDVVALKCAADLVYQHNLKDFTLITAPCVTSYGDSFPSNERLSFYHRDKSSGSDNDCLYEDQTYGGQHPRYQPYQTATLSFDRLKFIQLKKSVKLIETPDFNKIPKLEKLVLEDCINLRSLHPSIGVHKKLTLLNLKGCKNLRRLPSKFEMMSLEMLILSDCSKVKRIPEFGKNMKCASELYLDGTAITKLPTSIENLISLTSLSVRDCKNLISLPSTFFNMKSLEYVNISGCSKLCKLLGNLGMVESVEDVNGTTIRLMPYSNPLFQTTKNLAFGRFKARIPYPISLLSTSLLGLCSLTELDLSYCNLKSIPNDICCLFSLKDLTLSGNNFSCLPESITQLSFLGCLSLENCTSLRSLPKLPLNIDEIWGDGCTSLETVPNLLRSNSLCGRELHFSNCYKLADKKGFIDLFFAAIRIHLQGHFRHHRFDIVIPGSEIPEWFSHQSIGNEVTIQEPYSPLCNEFKGIAACVVVCSLPHNQIHEGYLLSCWLIANGKQMPSAPTIGKIVPVVDHIWLIYLLPEFYEKKYIESLWECDGNGFSQIGIRIMAHSWDWKVKDPIPSLVVKKCGLRMVYKKDIEDLNQTMAERSNYSIIPYESLDVLHHKS